MVNGKKKNFNDTYSVEDMGGNSATYPEKHLLLRSSTNIHTYVWMYLCKVFKERFYVAFFVRFCKTLNRLNSTNDRVNLMSNTQAVGVTK